MRAESGQFLFATGADRLELDMQPESEFSVEIVLNLNLGRGSYLLDAFVFDAIAHQEIGAGPVQYLHVNPDKAPWAPCSSIRVSNIDRDASSVART